MSQNLWDLVDEFQQIEEILTENGGDLTDELKTRLPATKEALNLKGKNFISYLQKLKSDSNIIDEEIKRLQALKKTADNKEKNMKAYLKGIMEFHGLKSIDFVTCGARLQNNPESVDITDEKKIPAKYLLPQPSVVDMKGVKEDLQKGFAVEGAALKQGTHIRLK